MKEALAAQLEALLNQEDFKQIRDDVSNVIKAYRQQQGKERAESLKAFKDNGGNEEDFVFSKDAQDIRFDELLNLYGEKKTAYQQEVEARNAKREEARKRREAEDKERLVKQEELLKNLSELVNSGAQANEDFQRFKDIQTQWKQIGRVALESDHAKNLQSAYNHQLELFRHNRQIAMDLLDLDYSRNLEAKQAVIGKLEHLQTLTNVNEVAAQLRSAQAEWNASGPVPRTHREAVVGRFKELADELYAKVQQYFGERKEDLAKNAEVKKDFCQQAEKIAQEPFSTLEQLDGLSKQVFELQEKWKSIGYSNENEALWQQFRGVCDQFFDKRKSFFKELDKGRESIKQQKIALCEKAEALQTSTEWQKTGSELVKMQREWQQIGAASKNDDNRLWERFRKACDTFFTAKKEHFSAQDGEQEDHLKAKEALVAEIAAHTFGENIEAEFDTLREFADKWNAIGLVPFKEKERLQKAYKKALDDKYAALKRLRDESRNQNRVSYFRDRIDNLKQSASNSGASGNKVMSQEEGKLRGRIEQLQAEISQYENNLGFFATTKAGAANPLLKEVEAKVKKLKAELGDLRLNLKVLNEKPAEVATTNDSPADLPIAESQETVVEVENTLNEA